MTPLRLQMIEVMCQAGLARNTQTARLPQGTAMQGRALRTSGFPAELL